MHEVLILGCGFTGRRVAERLRARGFHVRCTTRDSLNLETTGALSTLRAMVTPGVHVLHSIPTLADDMDRLAVGSLEGAARVVYFSTTGVYGDATDVDETTPAAPRSDRAHARLRTEQAVLNGRWLSLVLRPAAIYGPGRGIHVSLRATDSPHATSRIHVDDLAAHAEAALLSDITGAWPVADDYPCPSSEIVAFVGRSPRTAAGPPTRPKTNRVVDGSAIRRLLGITLKYPSYREGVRRGGPFRVVLAEDNPADVYLVREAFREHSLTCDLQVIDNGEDAIQYMRAIGQGTNSPDPDLLMVDLNLPRIDRGEVLDEFHKNAACRAIPLIVLSSVDAEQELRATGQLREGTVFFRKPVELDAFLNLGAKVKQLLEESID